MQLQLCVVDCSAPSACPVPAEVVVEAQPGTTLAELAPRLKTLTTQSAQPASGDPPACFVDGQLVRGDALVGLPPLLHGAVIHLGCPGPAVTEDGPVEVLVSRGPDSGRLLTVGARSSNRIGRAAEASLRLDDDQLSRVHAELRFTASGVTVRDAGSTNGSTLGGTALGDAAVEWPAGTTLRLGRSALEIRPASRPPAAVEPDGAGRLMLSAPPTPAVPSDPASVTVRMPTPPAGHRPSHLPVLALLAPVALAVVLAFALRSPLYLVLGLAGPASMVAMSAAQRRQAGRAARAEADRATGERERAMVSIAAELAVERLRREERTPDLADVRATVWRRDSWLWRRRPGDAGWLELRVGTGRVSSSVTVVEADGSSRHPEVDGPATVRLDAGPVALGGPRSYVLGLARSLVCQLVAWHGPSQVSLSVLSDRPEDWEWAALLPHCSAAAQEAAATPVVVVDGRKAQAARHKVPGTAYLLLVDGSAPPGATEVALGSDLRFFLACPEQQGSSVTGSADLVTEATAATLARALAPLTEPDLARESTMPTDIGLLGLLPGVRPPYAEYVVREWDGCEPGRLASVVGADQDGPVTVDLARDGPHLLVAGTTGAGKSELLQTLVAGLALGSPPQRLGFLLVDYKGGAAFRGCADLPHVLGLVTDLDQALTQRALRSLRAELRRREHLFRAAGVTDIGAYQQSVRGVHTPVPRLVVVVDEFRMLAEELPDFVSGLVGVAALGRSLGVHLVLATQRPAGVVSAQIKANVNLRIGLRMRDGADSLDVLDVADAAALPHELPGRALMRAGSGPVREFQTARVTVSTAARDRTTPVKVWLADSPPRRLSGREGDPGPGADGRTDLDLLVAAAVEAARDRGPQVPRPWLPPLPTWLGLSELDGCPEGEELAYGLVDLPDAQRQPTLCLQWGDDGGHIGVLGGPGSGRTSVLLTLARSAASRGPRRARDRPPVEVYAVSARAARQMRELGDVGVVAVTTSVEEEPWRSRRLLELVLAEVRRRRAGPGGAPATAGGGPVIPVVASGAPALLLLIDDWDQVVDLAERVGDPALVDLVSALLTEGAAAGLRVVLTGGRAVLSGRVGSLLAERFVLSGSAPADMLIAGLPTDRIPVQRLPGRAVRVSDGATVQFAIATSETPAEAPTSVRVREDRAGRDAAEARGGTDRARRAAAGPRRRLSPNAVHLPPLAHDVACERLAGARLGEDVVPVGLGGDQGVIVGLTLSAAVPAALILGRAGSGRSTALLTLGRSWLAAGSRLAVLSPLPSPLRALAVGGDAQLVTGPDDVHAVTRGDPVLLLVDDAGVLAGSAVEPALTDALRGAATTGVRMVVAVRTEEAGQRYRGLVAEAAIARNGLILLPRSPSDGQALQVRARRVDGDWPGRGLLVLGDSLTQVQVAS